MADTIDVRTKKPTVILHGRDVWSMEELVNLRDDCVRNVEEHVVAETGKLLHAEDGKGDANPIADRLGLGDEPIGDGLWAGTVSNIGCGDVVNEELRDEGCEDVSDDP